MCDAFIEACRDINPPFYNYMNSKDAQVESQASLIDATARPMGKISDAIITALNEINPNHASNGSITIGNSSDSELDNEIEDADVTIVQKAQSTIIKTLRNFRKLKPNLSDRSITISFCMKQFRTMAPPDEKTARGRAAHATLQGRKHVHDSNSSDDEDFQPRRKRYTVGSNSPSTNLPTCLRDCVCRLAHKYADCRYLNPASAPSGWTPIVQIQSKVITAIKGSNRLRSKIEKNFLRNKIALPKFWPVDTSKNRFDRATGENATTASNSTLTKSRAAHATSRFAFSTTATDEYDEYFRLGNCADTHVCNDMSRLTQYKPLYEEIIRFGDTDTRTLSRHSQLPRDIFLRIVVQARDLLRLFNES
ncbi:hypothetical protein B0J11DRAFT_599006 [Dendryphion nanum]|uniref:Uncharacterized protein n=1 Tax=Dendryphion nanum TaxID=256645 RepID=A0A9P9D292_9PLEO|nr:hypothetical protein B0J11DRAFT_599006 [Dendryphion nanum]